MILRFCNWVGLLIACLPWRLAQYLPIFWELVLSLSLPSPVLEVCSVFSNGMLPSSCWEAAKGNGNSLYCFGNLLDPHDQQLKWRRPMWPSLDSPWLSRGVLSPQVLWIHFNYTHICIIYKYIYITYIYYIFMHQRKASQNIVNTKELTFKDRVKARYRNSSQLLLSNILLTQFPVSLSDFPERYYFPFQYQFQQWWPKRFWCPKWD